MNNAIADGGMFVYLRVIVANFLRLLCLAAIALQMMLVWIADLEDNSAVTNCEASEYGSKKKGAEDGHYRFFLEERRGQGERRRYCSA